MFYAQLNEENICVGISQLPGEVIADDMIQIDSYDTSLLRKIWQNGEWIENPNPEPEPEPAPEPTTTDELTELMLVLMEGQVTLFEMQLGSMESAL